MFEIEQMEQQFDYSLVDNDTAEFLRSCEYEINGIAEDARVKFGTVLIKAKEKLSNGKHGVFRQWHESGGISKDEANFYMNLSLTSRNLDNKKNEHFLKAPKTVQKKVMQKNTPDEIKEAVLTGEVTTNKEFENLKKEYEIKLKQRDELIASREQENEILQSKLEDVENREPEVIERYTEPEDYQEVKNNLESMKSILDGREEYVEKLQKEIADMRAKRSDMDRKSKEYDRLNQAINEMNGRLDKGQKRIAAQKEVYDLVRNANRLIEEIAPLSYLVNTEEILDNEYAVKPIKKLIKNLNDITKRLNESINQTEILEVN